MARHEPRKVIKSSDIPDSGHAAGDRSCGFVGTVVGVVTESDAVAYVVMTRVVQRANFFTRLEEKKKKTVESPKVSTILVTHCMILMM